MRTPKCNQNRALGRGRFDDFRRCFFEIPDGEFVAVTGASGSGKSTLLGLIAGLRRADFRRDLIDGASVTK
jgi:putative ABC transport system ATP-binding protein